jgi:uncharacterized RDD family membrane protein YckC
MSQAPVLGSGTAPGRDGALGPSQLIRSPEQVALDLSIAGPMSRILAFSIDYGVVLILELLVFTALIFAGASLAELDQLERVTSWLEETQEGFERGEFDTGSWLFIVLAVWVVLDFLLQSGYFIVCELLMQGRSPGKAAIGLRVVREGGLPITLRESALRNLLRVVDMIPVGQYVVGLTSMIASKQVRRLGDFAAGTLVIRDERAKPARPLDLDARPRLGAPAFRFDREQLAAMGAVELRLVRQTLRRADELPTWKRVQVLERTVQAIRQRIGWQDELEAEHHRDFLLALLRDVEGR